MSSIRDAMLVLLGVPSFVTAHVKTILPRKAPIVRNRANMRAPNGMSRLNMSRSDGHDRDSPSTGTAGPKTVTWSPQDLTKDSPGWAPIPETDYIKQYQTNPRLWPVEVFLITYRRTKNPKTQKCETQCLVRRSANGTSKHGVGTGVPATRWVLSSQAKPPCGYRWSQPRLKFEAANFPEFPDSGEKSWSYDKIVQRTLFNRCRRPRTRGVRRPRQGGAQGEAAIRTIRVS